MSRYCFSPMPGRQESVPSRVQPVLRRPTNTGHQNTSEGKPTAARVANAAGYLPNEPRQSDYPCVARNWPARQASEERKRDDRCPGELQLQPAQTLVLSKARRVAWV